MKKTLLSIINHLYKKRILYGILLFIFILFILNTFHTEFSDEFDNIFGGFLITQGVLPHTGFFTHHNPGAYYVAALLIPFTGRSFVTFRIAFAILLFASFVASYIYLHKRLPRTNLNFFLLYGFLIGIGSTYWWGHMLLSETIVSFLLVPLYIIIFIKKLNGYKFDFIDILSASILTFFALFTSLTYIYLVPFINLVILYFYLKDNSHNITQKLIKGLSVFIIPYALFFIYLLLIGGLQEFYFQSIFYNVNYYIYNFPKVGEVFSHNPLRYAMSIAHNTFNSYYALLTQFKNFNFSYPFTVAIGLVNIIFLIYLLLRKQFLLTFLLIMTVFYTNARSDPLNISETDFHATVFISLTLSFLSLLLVKLKDELNHNLPYFERLILSSVFLLLGLYWTFNTLYLWNKFNFKVYGKIMGQDPLIYDNKQVAPLLNRLLTENDYYWIGPFELQELLFIKARPASKYYWFLPANSRDEKIKSEFITDLTKNRPKIIGKG